MTSDDPNFMTMLDLLSAKHAIDTVIDGLDHGLLRIEHVSFAIKYLNDAMLKMYHTKPSPTRFCNCGCGREATIAAYEGCG